jgi:hypothetical protein
MDQAVSRALGQMKREHERFGQMIGELDVACHSMEGDMLVNAINEITARYGVPVF